VPLWEAATTVLLLTLISQTTLHHCRLVVFLVPGRQINDVYASRLTSQPDSNRSKTQLMQNVTTTITITMQPFNGLFSRTTWVIWYEKGKTSLDLNEARDNEVLGCSGISWTICKQSATRSRQITTTTPHHSIFYRPDALPDAQPTVSKH